MLKLPKSDLVLSPLCLGTNVFGWSVDKAQSFKILDRYVELGGNFLDTADNYSQWKAGNTGGESEEIIGSWLSKRKNRSKIILASKVAKLKSRPGLSPANIRAALEDSLERLQTDYLDIYYSHEDDLSVPTVETLKCYTELIKEGKIRYIAASQHSGDRLAQALVISKQENLASYIALQDHYNLMARSTYERSQMAVVSEHNLSTLPFYGLAKGFLTGKYRVGVNVESVRAESVAEYFTPKGWQVLDALDQISKSKGKSMAAVALAWLRANPTVSIPIASATNLTQLSEIMQQLWLSNEEIELLNTASN
jgi:aryl-alcohol dehydrogenase-like predicted oxidoreductase